MLDTVLTIAATDSSNGAGTTADLATLNFFGVYGVAAITAVTAQNLNEVLAVKPVKNRIFTKELQALSADSMPKIKVIKLGLIPNEKILRTTVTFIREQKKLNPDILVVWDPVAVAGTGGELSEINYSLWLHIILPLVDVFTPNLNEALALCEGFEVDTSGLKNCMDSLTQLSLYFRKLGAGTVYLKGGHLPALINEDEKTAKGRSSKQGVSEFEKLTSYIYDVVVSGENNDVYYFGCGRFAGASNSTGVHGTGCIMASAVAAMLAKGYNAVDAIAYAKAYMTRGIENSVDVGARSRLFRHGYINNSEMLQYFPYMARTVSELELICNPAENTGFAPCAHDLGLYPVVDSSEWIGILCENGVKTMQLRIKKPESSEQLEQEIAKSVKLCEKYGARLFIDDYYELAIRHKAYGVHLGQEDLIDAKLNPIREAGLRLGVSTHGYAEIARACLLKPSYIALGHIYPTGSKVMASRPQGPSKLADYVALVGPAYPTVAIGGIKLHNLGDVKSSGVGSVAVITAITAAPDPAAAVREWLDAVGAGSSDPAVKTERRGRTVKKTSSGSETGVSKSRTVSAKKTGTGRSASAAGTSAKERARRKSRSVKTEKTSEDNA